MKKKDYEYKDLNTSMLDVDIYQRKLDMARVRKIAREWDEHLANAVKCSFRDGKYFVFDGHHTVEAKKVHNGGKDCLIECKVFYGLTWLDEVNLFILQNGISRPVHINDKLNALYKSGDPDVTDMVNLVESAGAEVSFGGSKTHHRITALSTLVTMYKRLDKADFYNVIHLITETWGGVAESYSAEILKGMLVFQQTYRGAYSNKRCIEALSKVSPTIIIREGKVSNAPGFAKYARQILNYYNYRLRDKLPDLL